MAKAKMTASERKRYWNNLDMESQQRFFKENFGIELQKYSNRHMVVTKIENDDLVIFSSNLHSVFRTENGQGYFKPENWPENDKGILTRDENQEHVYINLNDYPDDGWITKFRKEDLTEGQYELLQDLASKDDDFTWFKNMKNFGHHIEMKIVPKYRIDEEKLIKLVKELEDFNNEFEEN